MSISINAKGGGKMTEKVPVKIELTPAIEDPLVVLRDYSEKEYEKGKTRDIKKYAKDKDGVKFLKD